MVLTSLAPSFGNEPSAVKPENLALPRPYNNLSVGGCAIHDMLYATTAADVPSAGTCRNTIDLVLRNSAFHIGSQVDQAISLSPTFVILANFGNDYLGAVLSGTVIDGVTVTPIASFAADTNAAAREAQGQAAERHRDGRRRRHEHPVHDDAPAVPHERRQARPRPGRHADPAPRAEGLPDGRSRLPDPGEHARDAERRGVPALRLRHPVRGRTDASELQQAAPGGGHRRGPPGRPHLRGRRRVPQAARRSTTTRRRRPPRPRTGTSTTTRTTSSSA